MKISYAWEAFFRSVQSINCKYLKIKWCEYLDLKEVRYVGKLPLYIKCSNIYNMQVVHNHLTESSVTVLWYVSWILLWKQF